jgi:serine/threonine protein phosphatase 1
MSVSVTIGEWQDAPQLDSGGEAIFAIGDVHGLSAHLQALRDALAGEAALLHTKTRLVQVGDVIDGGPDSAGAVALVSERRWGDGFDASHVLIGNHEILMRLSLDAANAAGLSIVWRAWTGSGGDAALKSFGVTEDGEGEDLQPLLAARAGQQLGDFFARLETHLLIGNLVIVHAGIDPAEPESGMRRLLAKPWDELPRAAPGGDRHWAWIREPLLAWDGPAQSGRIVVHGHTPENKVKKRMGARYPGAHVLNQLRLGLDAGSWRTGRLAAAQLETGRYRIFIAEGPIAGRSL